MESKARLVLFACIPGIVVPLIAYSYEQERVMQTAYVLETTGEKDFFAKSWTPILVMCNRLGAALFAFLMLIYTGDTIDRRAPMLNYAAVAVSNVLATVCQYTALKYISFQMQSLSKCSKILWVMGWGYMISGKRYHWDDILTALVVTTGAFMFGLAGNIETDYNETQGTSSTWGIALMFGYLVADGFTSTLQEKIFRGYRLTHFNQMFYVNIFSSALAFGFVLLRGNHFMADFYLFVSKHPSCMYDIGLLIISQITAQNFIYLMIKNFGALLLATIMYSRQLLSIVFNTLWFKDPMTSMQWLSVAVVFIALFSKSLFVRRAFLTRFGKPRTRSSPTVRGRNASKADLEIPEFATKKSHKDSTSELGLKRTPSSTEVSKAAV
ncbi:hypothetical protein AAMO2058_000021300 [Amorphochlora amoebiformis]